MAQTEFGVNHPLAVKLYSRMLALEALAETYWAKFAGEGPDNVVHIKTETGKEAGDQITFGLRALMTGTGVQGDSTLEGNEEALTFYNDALVINQLRHATRSKGKMSEQRVPYSVRNEGKDGLKDWWADRWDTWFFNQICGNIAQTDTRFTGNNAAIAPSANNIIRAGDPSDDVSLSATTTNKFSLALIDRAVELANTMRDQSTPQPIIRPIRIEGGEHYVCFLHDFQVKDLRTSTDTGQWLDIQKAAMSGGDVAKSPIFTGALGMYNGVVLHRANRVTKGVTSAGAVVDNTRRAVLCGAQAVSMAFGRGYGKEAMSWSEELFDYKNQLGISGGCIAGMKKCQFNAADYGTIVISTFAAGGAN